MKKIQNNSILLLALFGGCLQTPKNGLEQVDVASGSFICSEFDCCVDTISMRDTILIFNSIEYQCKVLSIRNCRDTPVFLPISNHNTLLFSYSELGGEGKKKIINLSDYYTPKYLEIKAFSEADVTIALDPNYDWILLNLDFMFDTLSGRTFSIPVRINYTN